MSQTNGEIDGRWVFVNGNNTPRVGRVDLTTFRTTEILELPNSSGNHSSPFLTENTEYVIAGTRFSVPPDEVDELFEGPKANLAKKRAINISGIMKENILEYLKEIMKWPGLNEIKLSECL